MKSISVVSVRKLSLHIVLLLMSFLLPSCKAKEKLVKKTDRLKVPVSYDYVDNILKIKISNPFKTPIRCKVMTENKMLAALFQEKGPLMLSELKDSTFFIPVPQIKDKPLLSFGIRFGDISKKVEKRPLAFPFPKGKTYKVLQGYMGSFSHNDKISRYAIDFSLSIGDIICAADNGFVVGVIQTSKRSGKSEKYINEANYITLYHPETGLYTQYVHLEYQGSFVQIGDAVKKGHPIGRIGLSGFTTGPHLHFNVLQPKAEDWVSTPIDFEKGYRAIDLKKGQRITN